MKRILITTDFSQHSKHTIDYVLDFLEKSSIPIHILLINTYMVQQTDPKQVILVNDELKKKSKLGLEKEKEEFLKKVKNPQISLETASYMGTLKNVILKLIHSENIDLVAMGKDGGKHVESVATMLKEQECPLLITYLREISA